MKFLVALALLVVSNWAITIATSVFVPRKVECPQNIPYENCIEYDEAKTEQKKWAERKRHSIFIAWIPFFLVLFFFSTAKLYFVLGLIGGIGLLTWSGFFIPLELFAFSAALLVSYYIKLKKSREKSK